MPKATVLALVVPADQSERVHVTRIAANAEAIKAELGGGDPESPAIGDDWHVWVDEQGGFLPTNVRATWLARQLGWRLGNVLSGPAVFLGHDSDGDLADVPARVLGIAVIISDPADMDGQG